MGGRPPAGPRGCDVDTGGPLESAPPAGFAVGLVSLLPLPVQPGFIAVGWGEERAREVSFRFQAGRSLGASCSPGAEERKEPQALGGRSVVLGDVSDELT